MENRTSSEIQFSVEKVVMQPTSLCNLNCSYCYLPERAKNALMSPAVAESVARGIAELDNPVEVVWHAGEPLSCGLPHFSTLTAPFEELREKGMVTHAIQTNATLITGEWSRLFHDKGFRVGVSLDGPPWANAHRVGWDGRAAFEKILRGISRLKMAEIPFHIICVVSRENLSKARELYAFFAEVGCDAVGFNIEERLGIYRTDLPDDGVAVLHFWRDLFREWRKHPIIKVREFTKMLPSLVQLCQGEPTVPQLYDAFPSVAHNGDVVLLAPEFLNTHAPFYGNFVVGNVLTKEFLAVVESGQGSRYVEDFRKGVGRCRIGCEYFATCYGGQPGNKFFELGTLDGTETAFCRNSEKRLADAILCELRS